MRGSPSELVLERVCKVAREGARERGRVSASQGVRKRWDRVREGARVDTQRGCEGRRAWAREQERAKKGVSQRAKRERGSRGVRAPQRGHGEAEKSRGCAPGAFRAPVKENH